jgi:hypothetical protein
MGNATRRIMESLLCIALVTGTKPMDDSGTRSDADYLRTRGLVKRDAAGAWSAEGGGERNPFAPMPRALGCLTGGLA